MNVPHVHGFPIMIPALKKDFQPILVRHINDKLSYPRLIAVYIVTPKKDKIDSRCADISKQRRKYLMWTVERQIPPLDCMPVRIGILCCRIRRQMKIGHVSKRERA